ncbi:hypothetical protein ACFVHB_38370 [Kitasatospora sp. NPDC127111]|uniref:hypothetical protein n=1 Tax=Kitasatospora sp. NPDC127111 TaxID=3345363 RepID=UPI0036324E70
MSGQYPGQFGPPSGGAYPGGAPLGGIPDGAPYGAQPYAGQPQYAQPQPPQPYPAQSYGAQPYPLAPTHPIPALRPGMAAGPFGVLGRILWALVPVVTIGLLGVIPSLLLAIRRRRIYDVIGAVVFTGLFAAYLICAGVAGSIKDAPTADTIGMVSMMLLWFGAPLHFLAMDLRVVWDAGRPKAPAPAAYYAPPAAPAYPAAPAAGYAPTVPGAPYGSAPGPVPAPAPGYAPPAPGAAPAHTTGDELRELGELLRRQAREGGRP